MNPVLGYIQGAMRIAKLYTGDAGVVPTVATGITASTTQTLAGGTSLTAECNEVGTVANANDACTLYDMEVGQAREVVNLGANAMDLFPPAATDKIDGAAAGAALSVAAGERVRLRRYTATDIRSFKSA